MTENLGMVSGICLRENEGETEIIMVQDKSGKPPVNGRPGWGLPGGRIEEEESTTDALFREWEEEVGISKEGLPVFVENKILVIERMGLNQKTYKHYIVPVVLSYNILLRTNGYAEETGPPKWITVRDIATRKVPVFRSHVEIIFPMIKSMAIQNKIASFLAVDFVKNYDYLGL